MTRYAFFLVVLSLLSSCNGKRTNSKPEKLVWSDEFNYTGLPDSTKWDYDTGGHGWGNNEKQFYTQRRSKNTEVANGVLTISAHREDFEKNEYTSARLISKNKGDWMYGRIEIKAKLPKGLGVWPAIWMLPTDDKYGDWPNCGEIDIMEHVGYEPDSIYATVHTGAYNHTIGTQKGKSIFQNDVAENFHIYALEWSEDDIKIYLDDKLYFSYPNERKSYMEWPFDQRFHLLLNIAVGGDWGGKKGIDDSIFPQKMEIDYVRVYQ